MRLYGGSSGLPPKSLLRFGGKTLLHRHIETLRAAGVDKLTMILGYRTGDIRAELATIGAFDWVETIFNPRYREGAMVSLRVGHKVLRSGGDILFMDADVLYHRDVLLRLACSSLRNCLLIDRNLEPGEEPIKICLREGRIVEFGKIVNGAFDVVGEWPGFLRLEPAVAIELANTTDRLVAAGWHNEPYEPAIREILLNGSPDRFGVEDITGLPWIEIDTPEDLRHAHEVVFPALAE